MTSRLKNKQTLLSIFAVLVLIGGATFALTHKSPIPLLDIANTKEIVLGDIKLSLVMQENQYSWDDGKPYTTNTYKFYTTGSNPKLLKEVESQLFNDPEESKKFDAEPYLLLKDVTGDDMPEVFIMMQQNASNTKWYEILQYQDGSLIHIQVLEDRWVSFDQIEFKSGLVGMIWHSQEMYGKTYYKLEGNQLKRAGEVRFSMPPHPIAPIGHNACNITRWNKKKGEYIFVEESESCQHGVFNYDRYFKLDLDRQMANIGERTITAMYESFADENDGEGDLHSGTIYISNGERIIGKAQVGGYSDHELTDIDGDGIPELRVSSDGGGNRPTCFEAFYRLTAETFENISFPNGEEARGCDVDSNAGLKHEDGKTLYVSYDFVHMYPEAYAATTNLKGIETWPREARLCKMIETTYEYKKDVGQFVKVSDKTIEENIDTLDDGIFYYCH